MHKDLTKADKERIKNNIRRYERHINIKTLIISIIIFIGLAYLASHLIQQILSR